MGVNDDDSNNNGNTLIRDEHHTSPRDGDSDDKATNHSTIEKQSSIMSPRQSDKWPPLDQLIDTSDDTVTGIKSDVSFLLDIAVLGHAKCATTYISKWLQQHPEIQMFDREVCDLYDRKPARLVRRLYTELPPNNATHAFQRGFKCPGHFSLTPLGYFRTLFPQTKLIVGLRHPVRYLESYYNFRARHPQHNRTLPSPADGGEALMGACTPSSQGVCTDYAKFHVNLAKLGKTNVTNPAEQMLLHLAKKDQKTLLANNKNNNIANPLFLYDTEQLYDKNTTRSTQFRKDLQKFLGLSAPLLAPIQKPPNEAAAATADGTPTTKKAKPKVLDICEPRYAALRAELVAIGKRASLWIRKYLLTVHSVTVSSPEHFASILQTWKTDPCE